MTTSLYASKTDAIQDLIVNAIECDEVPDARAEYDIDAIADEVLYFEDAYDEATDTYRLNNQGFALKPHYDGWADVDASTAFWAVVEAHAL